MHAIKIFNSFFKFIFFLRAQRYTRFFLLSLYIDNIVMCLYISTFKLDYELLDDILKSCAIYFYTQCMPG